MDYADQPIPFGQWTDFVFKFRHNTNGNGFLQVWMDGEQIVNHHGNLGFNTPGYSDYAKFGYYNWSGSNMSSPRKVLLRSPTIVADPSGSTYGAAQVRTLLAQIAPPRKGRQPCPSATAASRCSGASVFCYSRACWFPAAAAETATMAPAAAALPSPSTPRVGGGTSPIDPAHILTHASADMPFSQQSGYTAQVINTYTSASQIPESGIHGTTLPNGETLRFGKTADPSNSLRKALAFQVRNSDPLTSKGMRAEISAPQNIEMNEVYWIAFSAYIHDWGTLASTDSSLFGTQVHSGDNALGLSPSFSLYTRQNGRAFQVQARYSEAATPSQSNSTTVGYAEYPIPFHQWTDFVLKFKHNTSGNGFLQVWMNGQMIANYQGSLGFNTPGMKDYAKFGYYNWTASAMNSTPRNVLLRAPTLVADPTGQTYSAEQVRTLLSAAAVH